MEGKTSRFLRFIALMVLALSLILLAAPPARAATRHRLVPVGPKSFYLAIGDSLAFGYQPDFNWSGGYSSDFFRDLKGHGVTHYDNLACPGETTVTMIKGGCPYPLLRKYVYTGPQLAAILKYVHKYAGQVSPVTLDIGANDVMKDINSSNCTINASWEADLALMDTNLTQVILPQLVAALTVDGQVTSDLLLMDYYDPFQNSCSNSISYVQELNQHLATDAAGFATLVDVFSPFGGAVTPDPNTCTFTWICSAFKDIHARDAGYSAMATAFEQAAGY